MTHKLSFYVQGTDETIAVDIKKVFNAGYAGSDQESVKKHIDELAELGVPAPDITPTLYPVSNYLALQSDGIQVQHDETSAEVEYVLVWWGGGLYVTIGSDHTDRRLETFNVPMAKQASPNVIAGDVWRFEDVKDHWNDLELECWVEVDGKKELYQQGTFADLMAPEEWRNTFDEKKVDQDGHLFFSGTVKIVNSEVAFATNYEFLLKDPVLERTIKHRYTVEKLPEAIE
ncbi:uncharacterized protein DUF2848 [Scopulibacillus darangshiensis]|uniref:Uncharacterized protein DUF2848 n=1 Tax=Scopulibacillus darangshiensis TaxID=442528 RepID=A0A4R2NJ80_9BACL|nr:DUF2848 domain-containing protein [Scopulibacillus darangshiensis]TCP21174.1 uncharacterized protein DUF2848 [Scopulibacillus darangshiensis]